jgi:hypothetical protein
MSKSTAEQQPLVSRCVQAELTGARFGDARLSARLVSLGSRLAARPGLGLPESIGNDSQLECSYRFLSNPRVTPDLVLEPHQAQTYQRIVLRGEALAVHDTTEQEFGGDREGLGPLSSGSRQGFFMHVTLAVAADGSREPLGVLAQRSWTRADKPAAKPKGKRLNGQASSKRPDRESRRWAEQVQQVEARKPPRVSLIHVGDRETDAFEMLKAVHTLRFVLRANHDRCVFDDGEPIHLRQACERATVVLTLDVPVSPRKARKQPGTAKAFPAREARIAQLDVRGLTVSIRQPYVRNGQSLQVNVVHARESNLPEGAQPIDWLLYTSEPIDTPEQMQRVIDLYRARWSIEEFFKALKTGCEVQSLQLETYAALSNAVALHLPIAWQLLRIRSLGRALPDAPAEQALTLTQLQVLRAFSRCPLTAKPTVREAMLAIAILGGYLITKAKGDPGWITLGRGMTRLLDYEHGWSAALAATSHHDKDPLEH